MVSSITTPTAVAYHPHGFDFDFSADVHHGHHHHHHHHQTALGLGPGSRRSWGFSSPSYLSPTQTQRSTLKQRRSLLVRVRRVRMLLVRWAPYAAGRDRDCPSPCREAAGTPAAGLANNLPLGTLRLGI